MAVRSIVFEVFDHTTGRSIENAITALNTVVNPDGSLLWSTVRTNAAGEAAHLVDLTDTQYYIEADGFDRISDHVLLPDANCQLRSGIPLDPLRPKDIQIHPLEHTHVDPPVPVPTGGLTVQGGYFFRGGAQTFLFGIDAFALLRLALDNRWPEIRAYIKQVKAFGVNAVRVLAMGSSSQNGFLTLSPAEPGYPSAFTALSSLLNEESMTFHADAFADNQVVGQPPNWYYDMYDLMSSNDNSIASCGNEAGSPGFTKNGWNPGWFGQRPTGGQCLASRGSDTQDAAPFTPEWDVSMFHPRRDIPKAYDDAVASWTDLKITLGYKYPGALLFDEPPRMGTDPKGPEMSDPEWCRKFFRVYSTHLAGATFHCLHAMQCVPLDGTDLACLEAAARGVHG